MKQLTKIVALIAAILFAGSPSALAVTATTPATSISATVDQVLSLGITIKEEISPGPPPVFGPVVTSMNHGTLIRSNNITTGEPNALRGKAFHVFLGANTSGRPYTITSTMAAMSNGATVLPRALGVFPIQATTGDGITTIGGTLASSQDAVGTGKLLYTSTAAGPSGVLELVYGLSGGNADGSSPFTGWAPIPPGQLSGTYASTITYTLTA